MISEERQKWNNYIQANGGDFLQSWEWGEFQKSLGRNILRFCEDDISVLFIEHQLPLGFSYFYAPRGPVLKDLDNLKFLLPKVKNYREIRGGVIFVSLEPLFSRDITLKDMLLEQIQKTEPIQPQETLLLNLTKNENELFKELDRSVRYSIRTAEKLGVSFINSSEINEKEKSFSIFWKLFEETNRRHGLVMYPIKYYKNLLQLSGGIQTELFFAMADKKYLGTALVLSFGDTATYLYAASSKEAGDYRASSALLWYIILDAKKRGFKKFDFWGISNTNPKWGKLTTFKKNFGGYGISYIGTWDLILNKPLYYLYKFLRKLISIVTNFCKTSR